MSDSNSTTGPFHIVLADGRPALVRLARPEDAEALREFHRGLSRESIYLRYFSAKPKLSNRFVHHFTHVDVAGHLVLFALEDDRIIGEVEHWMAAAVEERRAGGR